MNPREASAKAVIEIIDNQKPAHLICASMLKENAEWKREERAFAKRLTEGTVERAYTLDYLLNQASNTPVQKMKPWIRSLLRTGAYQLLYMESVPDSAACNEAVKLAKKYKFVSLGGYVNAVLRRMAREGKQQLEQNGQVAVLTSTPEWLLRQWTEDYGPETAERIAQAQFEKNPLTVRCNRSRVSMDELKQSLQADGVTVSPARYCPDSIRLTDCEKIEPLTAFQKGYFQIQDESSSLVGLAAGVHGGEKILDLCAAPGGKTLHLADLLLSATAGQSGLVDACDISEYKLGLIRDNIRRAGFSNIRLSCADASVFDESKKEQYDIVLADVPCSGTGVIGRKPDIKYNMSEAAQEELIVLQHAILRNAVQYVKPGGTLLFSTCTLNKKENLGGLQLLQQEGMKPDSLVPYLGTLILEESLQEGWLQLIPGVHDTDGFFIARMRKSCKHGGANGTD